jgi:hypothetical protein
MGWDLAPHFKDCCGNDYVGLDMVDIENLAGVLWRLDELITPPDDLRGVDREPPRCRTSGPHEGAGGEPHLRRPSPQTNVLSQTCRAVVAQLCRSVIKLRCRQQGVEEEPYENLAVAVPQGQTA